MVCCMSWVSLWLFWFPFNQFTSFHSQLRSSFWILIDRLCTGSMHAWWLLPRLYFIHEHVKALAWWSNQITCKQHGTHSYSTLLCAWRFHRQHLLYHLTILYKPCSNSPLLWLVPRMNWLGYLRLSASILILPALTLWSQAVYSCLSHTLHPLDCNCFLFCASNLSYIPTYKYTTLHSY